MIQTVQILFSSPKSVYSVVIAFHKDRKLLSNTKVSILIIFPNPTYLVIHEIIADKILLGYGWRIVAGPGAQF